MNILTLIKKFTSRASIIRAGDVRERILYEGIVFGSTSFEGADKSHEKGTSNQGLVSPVSDSVVCCTCDTEGETKVPKAITQVSIKRVE